MLLRRAQDAVDAVTNAEVSEAGLLDEATALAAQEWDIAVSLRDQARLRASRAEITQSTGLAEPDDVLLGQFLDAARVAERSVTDRVAALERFAAEVRQADAAHRDWHARARLAELAEPHLDMLARTAADSHGIAELHRDGRARPRYPQCLQRGPDVGRQRLERRTQVRRGSAVPEGVPSTSPGNSIASRRTRVQNSPLPSQF